MYFATKNHTRVIKSDFKSILTNKTGQVMVINAEHNTKMKIKMIKLWINILEL